MTRSFLNDLFAPEETSAKLAFSGNRLDRFSEERSDDCVEEALRDPNLKLFGMAAGRVLVSFDGQSGTGASTANPGDEKPRELFRLEELNEFSPKMERAVLLGYERGEPRIAVPLGLNLDAEDFSLREPLKLVDYRSLAEQGLVGDNQLGQIAQAAALFSWHASSRFCGRCGSQTQMRGGGVKRHCPSCERDFFPRTDPVVIMLIVKDDQCLLGRSPHFPQGMYSALAGFVEAGEPIETAVRRESFEESGIRIGDVTYHASQPWPFPHSLMIGCYATALESDIIMDRTELEDCRWFSRDQINAIIAGNGPVDDEGNPKFFVPPKLAIANRLLIDWAEGKV